MRVLIADGQAEVRYALRVLLSLAPGLNVTIVAEAPDAADLGRQLEAHRPDLLLADWQLLASSPIEAIKRQYPDLGIIVLSIHSEMRAQALADGADAFVYKGEGAEQLIEAIKAAQRRSRNPSPFSSSGRASIF